jgi:ABC-type branched-subunit amino acid transport system permease subunit
MKWIHYFIFQRTKINKLYLRRFLVFLLVSFFVAAPLQSQPGKAGRAIKKQERAEKSLDRDYEKSRKAALKHRYKIQTPEVKERMNTIRKRINRF